MVLVLICLSALGIVAVKGLASLEPNLLLPHSPKGITGFFAATGFVFISYAGVTQIAAVAEEVKNPARNIPAGIMLSAGLMAATYSLVALALVGTISYVTLTHNTAPIAALGERNGTRIRLRGLVGEPSGGRLLRGEIEGPVDYAEALGIQLAESLLSQGAAGLLAAASAPEATR